MRRDNQARRVRIFSAARAPTLNASPPTGRTRTASDDRIARLDRDRAPGHQVTFFNKAQESGLLIDDANDDEWRVDRGA